MTKISLSGYIISKKIGQGAMSDVYLGKDQSGQMVAIKILKYYFKNETAHIERLQKEALHLSKLFDERIVKFINAVTSENDGLAIVQEYVDGLDLLTILTQIGTKTLPVIGAVLISEILLGLEEAHKQGIIHRDLKPANIMITKNGKIKITDFGISKNLESETLTLTGAILGSPAYMSPEQVASRNIDQRSDIFSLGVLLYQMATSELPFKGNNYPSLMKSIIDGDYVPPEMINQGIHPDLAGIIKKAININLDERYEKVYQFRSDLLFYLDHIQTPASYKVLASFYQGDLEIENIMKNILTSTIIKRANAALKVGNRKKGFSYLQQVLAIDPENIEVHALISNNKNGISAKKSKYYITATFLMIMLLSMGIFSSLTKIKKETKKIKETVKTIPVSKIKTVTKKIKKKPTSTIIKHFPNRFSGIKFNVDQDVTVYLDDLKIPRKNFSRFASSPGIHRLTLKKKGFAPINSEVRVEEGKISLINAKSNDPEIK